MRMIVDIQWEGDPYNLEDQGNDWHDLTNEIAEKLLDVEFMALGERWEVRRVGVMPTKIIASRENRRLRE